MPLPKKYVAISFYSDKIVMGCYKCFDDRYWATQWAAKRKADCFAIYTDLAGMRHDYLHTPNYSLRESLRYFLRLYDAEWWKENGVSKKVQS